MNDGGVKMNIEQLNENMDQDENYLDLAKWSDANFCLFHTLEFDL